MQPADIFEKANVLGTNAVHYEANMVLANMATLLKQEKLQAKYSQNAERIKAGINKFVDPVKGLLRAVFVWKKIIKYYQNVQRHWAKHCVLFWHCR